LGCQHIWASYNDPTTFEVSFVTQVVYAKAMAKVKLQCAFATKKLISELGNCFPSHELMDALEVVCSQACEVSGWGAAVHWIPPSTRYAIVPDKTLGLYSRQQHQTADV
jgi:hypothetical protein